MESLPQANLKIRLNPSGIKEIYDIFRKKYVKLSPEEEVRQNFLHYLVNEKGYPVSLISIERGLVVNELQKRFDAVVYRNTGNPLVLLEFKSPSIKIKQNVFEQISAYNIILKVDYLIVSNGNSHYCCKVDYDLPSIEFIKGIPHWDEIK